MPLDLWAMINKKERFPVNWKKRKKNMKALSAKALFNAKNNSVDTESIIGIEKTVVAIGEYTANIKMKGEKEESERTLGVLEFDDGTVWATPSPYATATIRDLAEYAEMEKMETVQVVVETRGANKFLVVNLV